MTTASDLRVPYLLHRAALAIAVTTLVPSAAAARTPTPTAVPTRTDGPSPTVTTTGSPTPTGTPAIPEVLVSISPDPARSGQRVTLDGSRNDPSATYMWSQAGGDVTIQIEDADRPVAHFAVPDLAQLATVTVQLAVSPFDRGPTTRRITLVPSDWILAAVGRNSGPPGSAVPVDVILQPLGLAVTALEHEMDFDPYAPVADRGGGRPDCAPGADLSVLSASFDFVPSGCAPAGTCTGVRAFLTTRLPIPDGAVAYRCMVALVDEPSPPEDSCFHPLICAGGQGATSAGDPLTVQCLDGSDGAVTADYSLRLLGFDFRAEPAAPTVGDTVRLTFSVHGEGGLPHYMVLDAAPFLSGTLSAETSGPLGDEVSFDLHADCPGTAPLRLRVNYETLSGCAGHSFFAFTSQTSPVFPLTVSDPGTTPTPWPTATPPPQPSGAATHRIDGLVHRDPSCSPDATVTVDLEPLGGFAPLQSLTLPPSDQFVFEDVPDGDYMVRAESDCQPSYAAPVPVWVRGADAYVEIAFDADCPPVVVLDPTHGPPGTAVDLSGRCYLIHSGRSAGVYFDDQLLTQVHGETGGSYSEQIQIPENAQLGWHSIQVAIPGPVFGTVIGDAGFYVDTVPCAGDCDGDHRVSINELVTAVGIALGSSGATCPAIDTTGDGEVGIAELVAAVNSALRGCPS